MKNTSIGAPSEIEPYSMLLFTFMEIVHYRRQPKIFLYNEAII